MLINLPDVVWWTRPDEHRLPRCNWDEAMIRLCTFPFPLGWTELVYLVGGRVVEQPTALHASFVIWLAFHRKDFANFHTCRTTEGQTYSAVAILRRVQIDDYPWSDEDQDGPDSNGKEMEAELEVNVLVDEPRPAAKNGLKKVGFEMRKRFL